MTLLQAELQAALLTFEQQLARHLPTETTLPARLHSAMRYACLAPAKRLRPLWVYATCLSFNTPLERAHPAALAVELIHCYSLVHDDLPAMDDDALRRGRPTCHKAYDEATAILVGDALQSLAFELLSQPQTDLDPRTQLALLHELAQAAGSCGMVGGQQLDMQYQGHNVSAAELDTMLQLKTGKLIRASILMGARIAGASEAHYQLLAEFADLVGLAFQLKDDLLDFQSDTQTLGKTAQKDQARLKASAVQANNLTQREQQLQDLSHRACSLLQTLPHNTAALAAMVRFTAERSY